MELQGKYQQELCPETSAKGAMDLSKTSKQILFMVWQAVNPCSNFEEVMCVWTSASIQ